MNARLSKCCKAELREVPTFQVLSVFDPGDYTGPPDRICAKCGRNYGPALPWVGLVLFVLCVVMAAP